MSIIRFVSLPEDIYDCNVEKFGPNQIRLTFPETEDVVIPELEDILSGFYLLNEHNLEIMNSFEDYNYLYREITGAPIFELDNDNNPYVPPEPPTPPTPPTPPEPYIPPIADVLAWKFDEFSAACKDAIEEGIDVDIDGTLEHFSYSLSGGDQNNIDDIFMTLLNTGVPQYYHCDGGPCKLYDKWQIFAIYSNQKANKMNHTTYYNQICFQLAEDYEDAPDTQETVDEINALIYKQVPLTGKYLENYTQIMMEAAAAIEVYRQKIEDLDPPTEEVENAEEDE